MIYVHESIEINIINWIFYIFNTVNFALIIRGSKSLKYVQQSLRVTNCIKVYSLLILIIDILFMCFIGEFEKPNQPNSLDQKFKDAFPTVYNNLDIIGLRTNTLDVNTAANETNVDSKML